MSRTGFALAVAAGIAAAVTACGSSSAPTNATPTSAAGPPAAEISIDNFTFNTPATVPAGATIAVKNADPAEHSVTADSGDAFNIDVEGGETATFTAPTKPGSYPYHCSYHPMMHGTLIVK
jgi:plastocyanin